MCYRTINGIRGSCKSLCLLSEFFFFLGKKFKIFDIFLIACFFFCCGSLRDHCGIVVECCRSLWVVVGRCGIVVARCGSLWVVVGRSGF